MNLYRFEQHRETIQQRISSLVQFVEHFPAEEAQLLRTVLDEVDTLAKMLPTPPEQNLDSDLQNSNFFISPSEEKLAKIFQASPVAISISTIAEGRFIDVNNSFLDLVGYSREELINHTVLELGIWPSPADRKQLLELMNQQGLVRSLEAKYTRKSGEMRDALVSVDVLEVDGEKCVLAFLNDITERKRAEFQLHQLYQQVQQLNATLEQQVQERTQQLQQALSFEALLKRITDKVRDSLEESQILQTVVQELGVGLQVQRCATALHDLEHHTSAIAYEFTAVPATDQGQVVPIAQYPDVYEQLQQGQGVQFCPLRPLGMDRSEAILSYPISDDHEVLGSLHLCKPAHDCFSEPETRIVQQVANQCAIAMRQARLYQAAQVQVQTLEALNQLKDDFLSTVSHELRTPVSNMKMAIQMLKIAPSPERRQRYLEILQTECSREIELINDLLDLQRLESQAYCIVLEETISLSDWLPSVIEPFHSRVQERQQILHLDIPAELPPLMSDHTNLGRVIAELLNNACKYTQAGHQIIVSVRYQPESNAIAPTPQPVIALSVRNQANISTAQLARVFEKFYRVPHADPWQQGGTGLGLALVQKLAEQLQGALQVESANGWTSFTLYLPTQPRTL